MKFIPALTLLSTLAAGIAAAPVSLGDGLLGLDLSKLNACLFADLSKLSLKPKTALDVKSNTCISIDSCLSVKTREVVLKPVLGALLQVGVCQTKVCASGKILNTSGACVTPVVNPPKPPAPAPVKTCAVGRILNGEGVCVCAAGTIFADSKKQVCIAAGKCDLKLNTITKGVCLPKVCAAGKLLHSQLGLCIDASTCSLKVNGLCKEVLCPINKRLDANTGLCISLCAKGSLSTPNKQCISVSACSPLLNNVKDGSCVPKTCSSKLLSINKAGICVCLPGLGLNKAGTCVVVNASK